MLSRKQCGAIGLGVRISDIATHRSLIRISSAPRARRLASRVPLVNEGEQRAKALSQAARLRDLLGAPIFRFGSAPVSASCASIIMRMSRWVGMLALAAFAFRVASSAAGRRRLIDASFRASSKRTFFMPERSYSVRSARCSQASASSSLLKSGNFFDIKLDLFLMHEPHADRAD